MHFFGVIQYGVILCVGGVGGFGGQDIDISDIFSSIFGGGSDVGGGMGVDIGDILGGIGGRGRFKARSISNEGADVQAKLDISFKTSIFGGQEMVCTSICSCGDTVFDCFVTNADSVTLSVLQVKVRMAEVCNTCKGTGFKTPNTKPKNCRKCQGNGLVQEVQQTPFGKLRVVYSDI